MTGDPSGSPNSCQHSRLPSGRVITSDATHTSSRRPTAPRHVGQKTKKADPDGSAFFEWCSGGVLLSREASLAVPSALKGLTSGFGMGPGVSPSLWPPQLY